MSSVLRGRQIIIRQHVLHIYSQLCTSKFTSKIIFMSNFSFSHVHKSIKNFKVLQNYHAFIIQIHIYVAMQSSTVDLMNSDVQDQMCKLRTMISAYFHRSGHLLYQTDTYFLKLQVVIILRLFRGIQYSTTLSLTDKIKILSNQQPSS